MIRDELRERLKVAAEQSGCAAVLGMLLEQAKECAYLFNVEDEEAGMRVGGNRIGGRPDLPEGMEWPRELNERGKAWRYANFIAQLNLAEVPELLGMPLPRHGMLWLFARGATGDAYGVEIAAVYNAKPGELARRDKPDGDSDDGPAADYATAIRFERGVSLRHIDVTFRQIDDLRGDFRKLAHEGYIASA